VSRADAGSIGAVLPLRVRWRRDAEIIPCCRILFASLAVFAEPGLFDEIHVVPPARDRPEVERLCREWPSLPLVVLDEEDYLPTKSVGFFTVVQSSLGISAAEIGSRIAPYLKI